MNRRNFITKLGGIGLFSVLPGAGRVWRVERPKLLTEQDAFLRSFFFWEPIHQHMAIKFCDLPTIYTIGGPDWIPE